MPYTESAVTDRSSWLFFTMIYWVFDASFNALMAFPAERAVIFKERASGSYRLSAYFVAKTTSEAPTRLALPILYMIVSFWMANVSDTVANFVACTGVCLLCVMAGESLGLLVGATIMDQERAMVVMLVSALSLMLCGGYYVDNIPVFLRWLPYLSPFKYAYDASLQIVFDRPVPCDGSGILRTICGDGSETSPTVKYATVEQVTEFLGIQGGLGFNVGLLLLIFAVPRFMAFLSLRNKRGAERVGM